jgi:hypothetical protein
VTVLLASELGANDVAILTARDGPVLSLAATPRMTSRYDGLPRGPVPLHRARTALAKRLPPGWPGIAHETPGTAHGFS